MKMKKFLVKWSIGCAPKGNKIIIIINEIYKSELHMLVVHTFCRCGCRQCLMMVFR